MRDTGPSLPSCLFPYTPITLNSTSPSIGPHSRSLPTKLRQVHIQHVWVVKKGFLKDCMCIQWHHGTRLYNFDTLIPKFYIVKLGFTGVYIIFLILLKNKYCGYSLEPSYQGSSYEYPQSMFWAEIWKMSEFFIWKFSFFGTVVKFSIYLNRHVLVMEDWSACALTSLHCPPEEAMDP